MASRGRSQEARGAARCDLVRWRRSGENCLAGTVRYSNILSRTRLPILLNGGNAGNLPVGGLVSGSRQPRTLLKCLFGPYRQQPEAGGEDIGKKSRLYGTNAENCLARPSRAKSGTEKPDKITRSFRPREITSLKGTRANLPKSGTFSNPISLTPENIDYLLTRHPDTGSGQNRP